MAEPHGFLYVTAAKRLCRSVVGIDSEAGPTEIAILADDSAQAAYVAAEEARMSRETRKIHVGAADGSHHRRRA